MYIVERSSSRNYTETMELRAGIVGIFARGCLQLLVRFPRRGKIVIGALVRSLEGVIGCEAARSLLRHYWPRGVWNWTIFSPRSNLYEV